MGRYLHRHYSFAAGLLPSNAIDLPHLFFLPDGHEMKLRGHSEPPYGLPLKHNWIFVEKTYIKKSFLCGMFPFTNIPGLLLVVLKCSKCDINFVPFSTYCMHFEIYFYNSVKRLFY
jgi:hypothetical protein